MGNTMKEWALHYASLGLSVFPIKPRGKKPATQNGCKAATADKEQIVDWWDRNPDYNIGIATGKASGGLVVIDLDVDEKKGINGKETLKAWQQKHGNLPATWQSLTGRGGMHLLYWSLSEIGNRSGIYPGVDIRGEGGYIVAPPSIHENGQPYTWLAGPSDLKAARADSLVIQFLYPVPESWEKRPFELPEEIPEGERNDTLFRYAASLQAKGTPDDRIWEEVREANEQRCFPPLEEPDLETIVKSVLARYQKGKGMEFPDIRVTRNKTVVLPTAANAKALLDYEGIRLSYDMILREVKISCDTPEGKEKFEDSPSGYQNLLVHVSDQFTRVGVRAGTAKVHEWLELIASTNRFNAAKNYLETNYMIWGGSEGIETLISTLHMEEDTPLNHTLIRKWLCQCVAMAHNEQGKYGADGSLVLKGSQGIGKTSFFRYVCTIGPVYFGEGVVFDGSKDKLMENTASWISEMGEAPRSLKDIDSLKAFLTSPRDKFRVPYAKKADWYPRLTSFGATTNDDRFLKDDSNRRFWVIALTGIDLEALYRVPLEKVWAEAYGEFKKKEAGSFRLTKEERAQLEKANGQYRVMGEEEKLIREMFDWEQPKDQWKEMTATAIADLIGHNASPVKVGKALKRIGFSGGDHGGDVYQCRLLNGYTMYLMPSKMKYTYEFIR